MELVIGADGIRRVHQRGTAAHVDRHAQRFLDLGFQKVYLHNVGRNQTDWLRVFGEQVLPKLTA